MSKEMTPMVALKEFFGYLPGQGLKEFGAEIRALSADEKVELARLACAEMGTELQAS